MFAARLTRYLNLAVVLAAVCGATHADPVRVLSEPTYLDAAPRTVERPGVLVLTPDSGFDAAKGFGWKQAPTEAFAHPEFSGVRSAALQDGIAGSDFTLMPSRFEPCGLSQMYAQKFGSLPIGHQTGGLAETITDGETGFLFAQPSTESFLGGVRRAFSTFRAKDRLDSMRRSAMARSFSWDISAAGYGALYRKTVAS